jgi:hypothetical protein
MSLPYKHQARSYESIQKSYERDNQHTQISYERQVSEYKSKGATNTEPRRLPRSNQTDGVHLYTRYDDSSRQRRDGDNGRSEIKRNSKGGQYIREEFHTEEHYVITRTPLTKESTHVTEFPVSEKTQQTQELKVKKKKYFVYIQKFFSGRHK